MENKVKVIQPAYVKNFKCDGQRCGAKCCRGWRIDIDAKTFKKYEKIESAEKELTSHINFVEDKKLYCTNLDANLDCPFLTKENLCIIQKEHGENFLSFVCKTYPRNILNIDNFFECSLNLTCPLAAELALTSDDAIILETCEVPVSQESPPTKKIPANVKPYFYLIQVTSMIILKKRNLTIDQRLAGLGIFWRDIDELIKSDKLNEIEPLAKKYMSPKFFEEYGAGIFADINFNHQKFLDGMIDGVLKNMYTETLYTKWKNFFMPMTDDGENISLETAQINFSAWERMRAEFLAKVDTILSNYIANEIFYHIYPYRVEGSFAKNFAVLVAAYKIVEMELFTINLKKVELRNVINSISDISRRLDNNKDYLKKLLSVVEGEEDITKIISTFLVL